jgi:hypothetical protein
MEIVPYSQCDKDPNVRLFAAEEVKHFRDELNQLNTIILDNNSLAARYNDYLNKNDQLIRIVLSPYMNGIIRKLCQKRLLPSFLSRSKKIELKSYLQCESHYPKIMHFLD